MIILPRLFTIFLLTSHAIVLGSCEDDMSLNKGDAMTKQVTDGGGCTIDRTKLKPVGSPEHLLSGKKIDQNTCDAGNVIQFEERFYKDGTWKYHEFGAVLVAYEGKWHVTGDNIVTENANLGRIRRQIFQNNDGMMFIKSIIHAKLNEEITIVPILFHNID